MPFGYFTEPRVKFVVVADPQERGMKGVGVVCGDAAPCVGHKLDGRGNVNGLEWWAMVFDIVGSVLAREWWAGKNGESMRRTG